MSEKNGENIIKIGGRGKRSVQLSDCPPIRVDVIAVENAWRDIDRQFRDPQTDEVPKDKISLWTEAVHDFVRRLILGTVLGCDPEDQAALQSKLDKHQELKKSVEELDRADALEFLAFIAKECNDLRPFFDLSTENEQSSRRSTDVTYST